MHIKVAEVRKAKKDPTRTGRVQIRIYGEQNDEQSVKDEDLPWAVVMHPVTSPATSKVGTMPKLRPGCRVIVTYMPDDVNHLYPIIIGTIARGDLPEDKKNG